MSTQLDSTTLDTRHTDAINCIAFDFYGHKMATCSTDNSIKIYERSAGDTIDSSSIYDWHETSSIAHEKPVWATTWAHPECGTILAVVGFDGPVYIYQHKENNWQEIAQLPEAKDPVTYIEFAPPQFHHICRKSTDIHPNNIVLCLAALSQDGNVRFYIANMGIRGNRDYDIAIDDTWSISMNPISEGEHHDLRAFSWSKSWNSQQYPLIAVGCCCKNEKRKQESDRNQCVNRLKVYSFCKNKLPQQQPPWVQIKFENVAKLKISQNSAQMGENNKIFYSLENKLLLLSQFWHFHQ